MQRYDELVKRSHHDAAILQIVCDGKQVLLDRHYTAVPLVPTKNHIDYIEGPLGILNEPNISIEHVKAELKDFIRVSSARLGTKLTY